MLSTDWITWRRYVGEKGEGVKIRSQKWKFSFIFVLWNWASHRPAFFGGGFSWYATLRLRAITERSGKEKKKIQKDSG